MQTEQLVVFSGLAGMLLSLGLKYVPWFRTWFKGLSSKAKPLVIVGLLALGCVGYLATGKPAQLEAAMALVIALVSSQATHQMTRKL